MLESVVCVIAAFRKVLKEKDECRLKPVCLKAESKVLGGWEAEYLQSVI